MHRFSAYSKGETHFCVMGAICVYVYVYIYMHTRRQRTSSTSSTMRYDTRDDVCSMRVYVNEQCVDKSYIHNPYTETERVYVIAQTLYDCTAHVCVGGVHASRYMCGSCCCCRCYMVVSGVASSEEVDRRSECVK